MARGKKSLGDEAPVRKSGGWTEFVNISLNGATMADVSKAFPVGKDTFTQFQVLLDAGYRVSFSYDPRTDSVSCSLSGKGEQHIHAGKTMTSFAPTWVEAMQVALYKHYVIVDEDWSRAGQAVERPAIG